MVSPRPHAVAGLCIVVIVLGAAAMLPRLLREYPATSSTPVRRDAVTLPLELAPRQPVCLDGVTLDTDSEIAQLTLLHVGATGARMRVTATAPSYRSEGSAVLAPLQAGANPIDVPLTPPRTATIGRICAVTSGPARVRLAGTADPRALTRTQVTYGGAPLRQAPALTLTEARARSPLARVGQLVDRAAALSPAGPWLFWTLLPLLVLGLPVLVITALLLALRAEDDPPTGAR